SMGTVRVDISTDGGLSFSDYGLTFAYMAGPSVSEVIPSIGSAYGGTRLRVHGARFLVHGSLECAFGYEERAATTKLVSSTLLECVMPAASQALTIGEEVPLHLTCGGRLCSIHKSVSVVYTQRLALHSIYPKRAFAGVASR
ncbi:MAG: IPT/TIG domain-containing protein, partial [bacterium]